MKTKLIIAGILLLMAAAVWSANVNAYVKVVASAGTPELLQTNITVRVKGRVFIFEGLKAAHTTNTSQVWLQMDDSENNAVGGIALQPGQVMSIKVDELRGREVDWYIDVETAGDGAVCRVIQ